MDQHKAKTDTVSEVDEQLWSAFRKIASYLTPESKSLLILLIASILD